MERLLYGRDSVVVITWLSLVEIESAFAAKVRTGVVEPHNTAIARRSFQTDLQRGALVVAPQPNHTLYESARSLMFRYGTQEGLRTLDALQLAAALLLRRSAGISALVSSDLRLCRASILAGCPVLNPENPNIILTE
jgi:hypothetical protein